MADAPPWANDPAVSAPPAPQAAPPQADAPWAADPSPADPSAAPATHHFKVQAPNGHTYEFDAPADATPEQVNAMSRKAAGFGENYPVVSGNPEPGVGQQLWDATKNDVAGIAQGVAAIPDLAATALGKTLSIVPTAIGYGLDKLGTRNLSDLVTGHSPGDWWHGVAHDLANPFQLGHAIEQLAPTPDTSGAHAARFVGQLVGGAAAVPSSALDAAAVRLVGDAPKVPVRASVAEAAPSPTPSYAQLARDLRIRRTPATNSGYGVSTVIQSGLAALPGGAPVAAAAARESGDLATAAKGVAENVGQVSDRQGAGEAVAQGAQSYKQASGAEGKGMYQARDALIGGSDTPVATDNAASALNDMAAKFPTSPAIQQLREHPVIRAIENALPQNGQQLTLGEATEALSHVRGVQRNLAAQSNTTSPILARVNQLEQGLEDDVMAAANKADVAAGRTPGAEGSAVKAQQDADAFWADRSGALNGSLKRPLQSAADDTKVSGEAVYNQVAGDMDAKSGNLARLRDTWFRLPPKAKSTFAATKIDDLGRAMPGQQNDMGSAWSFNTFLTNMNKLSPQARNIVFGPKADADLQKIATYADRLRQLDRARNFSNTAQKYFAGAFMATVGGAVMHGDIGGAAEAAGLLPATWGGAKLLLATPAMRDWTAKAMGALTSNNETALKVLTKQLGTIAATQPAIASQATSLQKAIMNAANDNLRQLAASRGQQNPQAERRKAN